MKISKEILKEMIQEELKNILKESIQNLNIHNIIHLQDGYSSTIPLVYDGQLMEAYETRAAHVLHEYFGETIGEEKIEKLVTMVNDSVEELCFGEGGFQAQELLKTLDPKFEGIAKGHLIFDDYGDSYVNVKITPSGLKVVEGQDRIDENGELEISLGYGDMPDFDYNSIINPSHRLYDTYFNGMDVGSGGYGNQDVLGSVYVDFNKLMQDVNSGKLGIRIEGQYVGNIEYKITMPID